MAEVIKTAPVAGEAYSKRRLAASTPLTHAIVIRDGELVRVLCKRVQLAHILDDFTQFSDELPTCPTCRKRVKTVK